MRSNIWICALALPLTFMPRLAHGQCCTMPMGDGDHPRSDRSSDRRTRRDIDRILSRLEGRRLLMEALLSDREFTEAFIGRMMERPEWRTAVQKELARAPKDGTWMSRGRTTDRKQGPEEEERRIRVTVDEDGFHPAAVTAPAGVPLRLVVTRTSDNTCAKEIVIPSLDETATLPLNRPVEIRIPPQEKGSLTFACGMNMYRGRLLFQ